MARSAAQRAARRALRASRPVFPLTELPLELQLAVVCQCDPVSFRRVLRASAHFRHIFLSYPETCIQRVFGQLPPSLFSLLHTSWALHNIEDADFDTINAIELLANGKVNEHFFNILPILADDYDPFFVLDGLVNLYEEVHIAAELYAQSLNAAVEACINPWVEIKPITLSSAESFRVESSHWILKIFYQLQLTCSVQEQVIPLCRAFLNRLDRWQIEQVASLDQWLLEIGYGIPCALYNTLNTQYSDWKILSNRSTYAQRYFQTLRFYPEPEESLAIKVMTFWDTARSLLLRQLTQLPPPWVGTTTEALSRLMEENLRSACPLRTFGWILYECMIEAHRVPQPRWRRCFVFLGMFFWDYDRLEHWGIAHQSTFHSIFNSFEDRLERASRYAYRSPLKLHPCHHYPEEQKAELITRWTRSPALCTFEEWLYQEIALSRYSPPPFSKGSFNTCTKRQEGCGD